MAKSKFFRVATEGGTTDGREIERAWIEQMARNYNREKYAARVNIEHIRGYHPDSGFGAYGDVLALESRKVEGGKLALFAQIDPLPELVEINKRRQKIFSSIEINTTLMQNGEAYLQGLAVTDSPASLGTEELKFASQAQHNWLAGRKQHPENLFSAAQEFTLELEEDSPTEAAANKAIGLFTSILQSLSGKTEPEKKDPPPPAAPTIVQQAPDQFSAQVLPALQHLGDALKANSESMGQIKNELSALRGRVQQIEQQPDNNYNHRPAATGGNQNAANETDC